MKTLFGTLLFAALISLNVQAAAPASGDTRLWYKQPAEDWNSALPVGNGRIGAMVFGDYFNETIQLNEESIWAGAPEEGNADAREWMPRIQALLLEGRIAEAVAMSEERLAGDPLCIRSYQSFGEIKLDFYTHRSQVPPVSDYCRELDLATGVATTQYTIDGVRYRREVFASAPDDVLAIRMSADKPGALTFKLAYVRERDAIALPAGPQELEIRGQIIDLPGGQAGASGPHLRFAGCIRGEHRGGKMAAVNNALYVEGADEVTFYFTAASDYNFEMLGFDRSIDPFARCREILDRLGGASFAAIRDRHIADHDALFGRVSLRLGKIDNSALPTDVRLQRMKEGEEDLGLVAQLFQYGRYLLMGSSRTPGILPANLQGIWCQDMHASWNSDFHTNINIQMNYWPANLCNLAETVAPFSNLIDALRVPGRVTASKTFNSTGWTVNHVTNPYGHTSISDGVGWGTYPVAGSWLALHPWEYYLFTEDETYLRDKAYPVMRESAEFILGFLIEDPRTGWLVTAPSNSPENAYLLPDGSHFRLTYGATMDFQIIAELFGACIRAAGILKTDTDFAKQLAETLKRLPPTRVSPRYGIIQEWIEDYEEVEPGHRHMSQLFGLYPGTTITAADPETFAAAARTIERRRAFSEGNEHDDYGSPGWSKAWRTNFYARLFEGDQSWHDLRALMTANLLVNLFGDHPPFQIDGNFGATAGIGEMLLQSHTGEIHLLPALPTLWSEGEIRGLCARGGYEVDIVWQDGRLTEAVITASTDRRCTVRYDGTIKNLRLKEGVPYLFKP